MRSDSLTLRPLQITDPLLAYIKLMKDRIITILIFFIFSHWVQGQSNIESPVVEYVQTENNIRFNVTIAIDSSNSMIIGGEQRNISEIRAALTSEIIRKSVEKQTNFNVFTIELYFDKASNFSAIKPVLDSLHYFGLNKVIFVCNSEVFSRISGVWTTGISYWLGWGNESSGFSLATEIGDRLNGKEVISESELAEIMSNAPPPPPPSSILSIEDVRNQTTNMAFREITIDKELLIEGKTYSEANFSKEINALMISEPYVFILTPTDRCTYEQFIFCLSEIRRLMIDIRNVESLKEYKLEFLELNFEQRDKIGEKFSSMIYLN